MNEAIQWLNARAPDILRTLGLMEMQIAILALLVLVIERLLQRPMPKIRYALWLIVLVKCLLPPIVPMPEAAPIPAINLLRSAILQDEINSGAITQISMPGLSTATMIFAVWLLTSCALGLVALRRYWRLRLQLREAQPAEFSEDVAGDGQNFSWPPIWRSEHLSTPLAVGLLHPRIYLTGDVTKSNRDAQRAVLYHELAHVLRRDGWVVLLQTIAQILHPFNPLVWLMNLCLARYREQICDDFALQHSAVQPRQYGETLLHFFEASATLRFTVRAGTCFFETANGFKQRLQYLLTPKEVKMNSLTWKHKMLVSALLVMLPMVSWQCNQRPQSPVAPATLEGKIIPPPNFAQFDQPPQVVKRALPKYPQLALKAGIGSIVWIKLKIDEHGKIEEAQVEKSTIPALGFEEAATMTAAKQFEFTPAKLNQRPVATWVTIPFHFKLTADKVSAQNRYFQFDPAAIIVLPEERC
jgi:TonB family protein